MKVAIVILNWNGKALLQQFLPSVVKYSGNTPIYVADNASTDDSIAFLKKNYPQVSIIQNPDNGGYSKGYNQSLKQIDAEYYVLLNSDVEVTENWLQPIISLMDSDSTIGACQPKIKDQKQPTHFEYAGAAGGYLDKYGYPFCKGRLFYTLEEDLGQYNQNTEIFWASGACLVVKASLYNELGGFDETLFSHMEEIDFCWQLKNRGYKVMYCAESEIYHQGGATLETSNPKKTYYNFRNSLFVSFKNLPDNRVLPVILTRLVLDGIAGIRFGAEFQFKHLIAILKAHMAFYKALPLLKKQREKLAIHRKANDVFPPYNSSIVNDYFVKRKKKFSDLDQKLFR